MKTNTEYRHLYVPATFTCEERAEGEGLMLRGYAAVFDQETIIYGMFREVIRAGAFAKAINKDDVRALFNHDRNVVLGRTKSKTLRLSEDTRGLAFEIDLPNTTQAKDLHTLIQRGDIDQMSFGFVPKVTKWSMPDGEEMELCELIEVELRDVSPVTWAAYPMTEVEARSLYEAARAERTPQPQPYMQPEPDFQMQLRSRQLALAMMEN